MMTGYKGGVAGMQASKGRVHWQAVAVVRDGRATVRYRAIYDMDGQ